MHPWQLTENIVAHQATAVADPDISSDMTQVGDINLASPSYVHLEAFLFQTMMTRGFHL
jgi:hypothetical protein